MRSVLAVAVLASALALPADAASPPSKELTRLKRQVATLKAQVAALKKGNAVLKKGNSQWIRSLSQEVGLASALKRHIVAVDPCPITVPTTSIPPGGRRPMHGNGKLWVGLWESNIVVWPAQSDGSIHVIFGWWRGVVGQLGVHAQRVDGAAPAPVIHVPGGYGTEGSQPVSITFPTSGCWKVTGQIGDATLTFTTLVLGA
jgi:hypothetical protein